MKFAIRFLFAAALALVAPFPLAHAEVISAVVVASCGTPPQTYSAGLPEPVLIDTTGKVCVNATVTASLTGSTSNASSGVATSSTNVPTVSYNYFFNGTTWDQAQDDGSKNLKVNCEVGCAGGSASNASSGVATSSTNGTTNAWLYGFNGTTWDQLQDDANKNLKVVNYQGSGALSATNGLYANLLQGNAVLASGNPLFAQLTAGSATAGKFDVLGNAGAIMDAAGQNASAPANALQVGGQFNTTPTTITNGNFSPFQLDNAGNLLVNIKAGASSGAVAQGSTTSGQTGGLTQAAVTTSAPSYTNGQTNPLSLDTAGNLRVNVTTAQGTAQGTAISGITGSPVMAEAVSSAPSYTTGQLNFPVMSLAGALWQDAHSLAGTALGAPSNYGTSPGAVEVAGVNAFVTDPVPTQAPTVSIGGVGIVDSAGTNVATVKAASTLPAAADKTLVVGLNPGTATAGSPTGAIVTVQGVSGGQAVPISGALTANQSVNVAQVGGTNTVTGGVAGVLSVGGNVANGVTATANPVPVGGVFTTTPATLTTGQTATRQFTAAQNAKDDLSSVGGTATGALLVAVSTAPVTATNTALTVDLRPDSPGIIALGPATIANSVPVIPSSQYPGNATAAAVPVTATATGTTAATAATIAAVSGKTAFICGFTITADATALAVGTAVVSGTISGSLSYLQGITAVTSGAGNLTQSFNPCVPASAANTAIAVTSAAAGTGGNTIVNAQGYYL